MKRGGGVSDALAVFNHLPEQDVTAQLLICMNAPAWAHAVAHGRPYPDRESLLATAYRLGVVLDAADLASALARHPRIGDRPGDDSQEAAHSRSEQGSVNADDAAVARALREGNVAYEERFGQVFLIRAAGRSGPQILEAMATRLMNDPQTEAGIVREQLAQIAQLRLDSLLAALDQAPGDEL